MIELLMILAIVAAGGAWFLFQAAEGGIPLMDRISQRLAAQKNLSGWF
ncbi:MAG: hypothetical protein RL483_425 [Pseudomonadota bacterium]|jgi:hypothetical protein